jgi:hypothetical protein
LIGKQFKNQSFRSTLDYVLGKEKATIIDSNMGGTTPRQLAKEFGAARRMRPNLQRACAHVILSIPHRDASHEKGEYHEHLEDEQYAEIAQRWMKEMKFLGEGFHKSQYVIARHHDTEHEHIHIIASRIRMDSSVVPDSWDYRRSEVVMRQLEKEYGLEASPCSSDRVATTVKEKYGIETTVSDRRAQTQKQKHHSSGKPPVTQLLAEIIDQVTQDKPTVTELIARLQQQGVVIHPQFSTRGLFKEAIAFEINGVKVAGNKLGSAYSFPGLQKKRGISYDPERDLAAIRKAAAGELVELAVKVPQNNQLVEETLPAKEQLEMPIVEVEPSTTEQLVLVSPVVGGDLEDLPLDEPEVKRSTKYSVASPSIKEKLKLSINTAAADYPSMPELIAKLYSTGVGIEVEFSSRGSPKEIFYKLDDISTAGSNLGKQYSFGGLQKHLSVDYNPEWDNRLIETLMHYGTEGRAIDDSYIDRLRRYRQTKEQEARRTQQAMLLLGMRTEDELPVAIASQDRDEAITIETNVAVEKSITAESDTLPAKSNITLTIDNASDDSGTNDCSLKKDAANENTFDQFVHKAVAPLEAIEQEYANKIGTTIRLLWQHLGQPKQINGKHYDLQLVGETLQLMRKTGKQIACIPLSSSEAGSFEDCTQEDCERFDELLAILKSENLQQSQQAHQHQRTELD